MSNPEGSLRPVSMRILVPNEAPNEDVELFSRSVADYWLEGVSYDPEKFIERQGTVVELFLSATGRKQLEPVESLDKESEALRADMEHVLLYLEFDEY